MIQHYTSVERNLPKVEDEEYPHLKRLILRTERFGIFLGFYDGTHFRTSYAEILEGVTHWAHLPRFEEEND